MESAGLLGSSMHLEIKQGDCLDQLRQMADQTVNCCVTSPPYWGLRDYGHEGQIGLEKTPDEYVAKLVAVFREVRRVLADDGTLWLNLGDSYATGGGAVGRCPGGGDQGERFLRAGMMNTQPNRMPIDGLKPKDLVGIPWRVAFALQQPYYTGRIKNEMDRGSRRRNIVLSQLLEAAETKTGQMDSNSRPLEMI